MGKSKRQATLTVANSLDSFSATIRVPVEQPTIQAAIDVAAKDGVLLVAPGTYKENIDFQGKNLDLESESGATIASALAARPNL